MAAAVTNPEKHWSMRLAHAAYNSRRRIATGMAALLAIVIGYHVVAGQNGLTVYRQKKIEDHTLALQIEQLKEENARLKEHVDRLQSDPDAIEHEAREKLHYTRPGEVIYTLNDKPGDAPDAVHNPESTAGPGEQSPTGK